MNRDELEQIGTLIFGYGWKVKVADALEVGRKTVSRWIASDSVPDWAAEKLRGMAGFPPPPTEGGTVARATACREAVEPHLQKIITQAESVGWPRDEVSDAIVWIAPNLRE